MEFIAKFKSLSKRQDKKGLFSFLNELANDPDTFSAKFSGVGSCNSNQVVHFYYSQGEIAFLLIDKEGCSAELGDEEKFNDELPIWFSEFSHRVSPFAQVKALTDSLKHTATFMKDIEIIDSLSIVVSNTYIINYYDYERVYDGLGGAIFHDVKDINAYDSIPDADNNETGRKLYEKFLEVCIIGREVNVFFDPFRPSPKKDTTPAETVSKKEHDKESDGLTITTDTQELHLTEKELNDFFALEDPDFRTVEEAVNVNTGETMTVKKDEDMPPVNILEAIGDPIQFLNNMVGLDQLKTNMSEIVSYAKYANRVKETFPNYPHLAINLHSIITGNPGTGKTTMCRIYGSLLHQAGVLSKGHTVVASRGTFVGQQFGVEEKRMRQCLKLAQGGCLFIDEAGLLINPPHPHDPGRGVIQLLLQILSEEQNRDIAVVLALYANDKSLEKLYDLNPGIKSRFVNVLTFPDYTWTELQQIAHKKMNMQGFTITPKAWHKFCQVLKYTFDNKDKNYGNAREVVNLLQRCIVRHAVRCEKKNITGKDLLRLTVNDIPETETAVSLRRKLGFN